MHVLVLIHRGENVRGVDHHPPEAFIGLLHLANLPDGCADLGGHVLLLLDNVFLSQFELKGHLAGIGFDCDVAAEVGQAVEDLGHCELPHPLGIYL